MFKGASRTWRVTPDPRTAFASLILIGEECQIRW